MPTSSIVPQMQHVIGVANRHMSQIEFRVRIIEGALSSPIIIPTSEFLLHEGVLACL